MKLLSVRCPCMTLSETSDKLLRFPKHEVDFKVFTDSKGLHHCSAINTQNNRLYVSCQSNGVGTNFRVGVEETRPVACHHQLVPTN